MKIMAALRLRLAGPRAPLFMALLAVALTLPSLGGGLAGDDLLHREMLKPTGYPYLNGLGHPLFGGTDSKSLTAVLGGLFSFLRPEWVNVMRDRGFIPWWSQDTLRLSFLRPIAALTHWIDYRLWPDSPFLMHAQSLLWFGAAVFLAAVAYRRFIPVPWTAGLAALLFAVDDAHLVPATWIANRNSLLALLFGMLCLLCHYRWRHGGRWPSAFLSICFLALSLLSAEMGVSVAGYLVAYALFLDRGTWRNRFMSLLPAALTIAAWRYFYQLMGYGASGSGFYLDPVRDPLRTLPALLRQGPALLLGQWGLPDAVIFTLVAKVAPIGLYCFALAFLAVLVIGLAPLIRRDPLARFFGAGMLLALAPASMVSFPEGRLLIISGFGAMGLMALWLGGLVEGSPRPPGSGFRVLAIATAVLLVGFNLILAPLQLHIPTWSANRQQAFLEKYTPPPIKPKGEESNVLVVNPPCAYYLVFVPVLSGLKELPMPARTYALAPGYASLEVTRVDGSTIALRPEYGFMAPLGVEGRVKGAPTVRLFLVNAFRLLDRLFRGSLSPMAVGRRVEMPGKVVEVLSLTDDGRPLMVTVSINRTLEDPSLTWLKWDWQTETYVPFMPPAVGQTVHLPGPFG